MTDEGQLLLVGGAGQVGQAFQRMAPSGWSLLAPRSSALDITDKHGTLEYLRETRPSCIVNAAAYTLVDQAEKEPARAYSVNRDGAGHLADAASQVGARLIQLSTDYVFNGLKSSPYLPSDPAEPLGVYGASKLAGENRVRASLGDRCVILRTSAVYGSSGRNFVKTMLRIMAERRVVHIALDQTVSPTWTGTLADALWRIVRAPQISGIHHFSDAGVASWYDFAVAIAEEGLALGLLPEPPVINPIPSVTGAGRAPRPKYSVLDKSLTWGQLGIQPVHWRDGLRHMLRQLAIR